MKSPPIPENEAARLQSLQDLDLLDTSPEFRFDRLTRLTAQSLDTEYSEINLIDDDRQWSKSMYGSNTRESSRENSFCAHVIAADELTVVPDATEDSRFTDNPFVTEPPNIRFYIAMPIKSPDGYNIGTLCAFDPEPRNPSNEEIQSLKELATLAEDQLQRKTEAFPDLTDISREVTDIVTDLQHQVRNNLQMILSLLSMERSKTTNEEFQAMCRHLEDRVGIITLLYDCLDQDHNEVQVSMKDYVESLLRQIYQRHNPRQTVELNYQIDEISMELERAPLLGLLLHELVINSLQHAPHEQEQIMIQVHFHPAPEECNYKYRLTAADNGRGFPELFNWREDGSLGMKLIRNISENKFNGDMEFRNADGVRFCLDFS